MLTFSCVWVDWNIFQKGNDPYYMCLKEQNHVYNVKKAIYMYQVRSGSDVRKVQAPAAHKKTTTYRGRRLLYYCSLADQK